MNSPDLNFKELWGKLNVGEPDAKGLYEKIGQFKKNNIRRLIQTNLLLLATSAFVIFIWVYFQPAFLSTKIGIILVVLAMLMYLLAINKNYSLLKSTESEEDNSEHLNNLLRLKARQKFIHTTILNLYFILLSAGLGLYLFEYTSRMSIGWAIFTYALTAAWILINWFYFRPKQIERQQTKLNDIIARLEEIQRQMMPE